MTIGADGTTIYVAEYGNNVVRRFDGTTWTTFAGTMGVAGSTSATGTAAQFNIPFYMRFHKATQNLIVAELTGARLLQVAEPTAAVTTIAGVYASRGRVNGFLGTNRIDDVSWWMCHVSPEVEHQAVVMRSGHKVVVRL